MSNITHLRPNLGMPENDVVVLRCVNPLRFDPEPLRKMFAESDMLAAEDHLCRILEEIVSYLDQLQCGLVDNNFANMARPAHKVAQIADRIGLTEVSIAANHVASCLHQRDGVALEATMARLERSFDIAVAEVWTYRDG